VLLLLLLLLLLQQMLRLCLRPFCWAAGLCWAAALMPLLLQEACCQEEIWRPLLQLQHQHLGLPCGQCCVLLLLLPQVLWPPAWLPAVSCCCSWQQALLGRRWWRCPYLLQA
jgi:hypothetical protein